MVSCDVLKEYSVHTLKVNWIWLREMIKELEGWDVVVIWESWRVFWPI
jgi:hypothetical protein